MGSRPGRPLAVIARQTTFRVAVIGATVGYAVMLLVMTATPLAMVHHNHHQVGDAVHVIQAHVLAMFAPSFFSGALVRRFGAIEVLLAGLALLAAHVLVAASGTDLANFFGALVLLGVGWNFTYVAGTALLTEAYAEEERAKTQAANELILQSFEALASLASGWLLAEFGWRVLTLSALPALAIAAMAAGRLLAQRREFPGSPDRPGTHPDPIGDLSPGQPHFQPPLPKMPAKVLGSKRFLSRDSEHKGG